VHALSSVAALRCCHHRSVRSVCLRASAHERRRDHDRAQMWGGWCKARVVPQRREWLVTLACHSAVCRAYGY